MYNRHFQPSLIYSVRIRMELPLFLGGLIWGGKNMPIKPGVRAFASGGFQVNPAAVCLM